MDWDAGRDLRTKGPMEPHGQVPSPGADSKNHPSPSQLSPKALGRPGGSAGDPPLGLKRRLYFFSGFDPRGASFYWRLFGQEVAQRNTKDAKGDPRGIQLVRRRQERDHLLSRWRLQPVQAPSSSSSTREPSLAGDPSSRGQGQGQPNDGHALPDPTSHEIVFLHWDDIARSHWPRRSFSMFGEIAEVYRWYLLQGGLLRIVRLCPGVALCGAYPGLFTALALLIALLSGAALGGLAYGLIPSPSLALGAAVLVALGTTWLLLLAAWALADRLGVVWLWRSIRFTHRLGQARDGDLRARVGELARRILDLETQAPAETVLLVGHSSGSFVMAMLAAELRRQDPAATLTGRLSLLSLGQNLANLAVYPGAQAFHADLQELAQEPRLPWLDVTSHDDLLCFAGVDPYRSCGLPAPGGTPYPTLRLIKLAEPRGWLEKLGLAFQQFDLHFHYLRRGPGSHGYDPLSQLLDP